MKREPITVYGDGTQTRDYVYTTDLCRGIVNAIEKEVSGVFLLGTGVPTSLNQLVETLSDVTGVSIIRNYQPKREGEVLHTHCDISRAKQAIDFLPRVPLRAGLASTWEWFREYHDY